MTEDKLSRAKRNPEGRKRAILGEPWTIRFV